MGYITNIPIIDISVMMRQRTALTGIQELARDIERNGLLNPITVREDKGGDQPFSLIAGGRRLEAHRELGIHDIECKVVDADDERAAILEFAENEKRMDLPWQDKVQAFKVIWAMTDKSGRELSEAIGMSKTTVSQYKLIAESFNKVKDLESFRTAYAQLAKKEERIKTKEQERLKVATRSQLSGLNVFGVDMTIKAPPAEASVPAEVKNVSFLEWAPTYKEMPFTLVHCDFPYGIGLHKSGDATAARRTGELYEDTVDTYYELLDCLNGNKHLFADNCHLIFWFSMHFYRETLDSLQRDGGWKVDPFPLIWDKSPAGMLPDANRGYRRVYETALFATKGDPKVLQPKSALARGTVSNLDHPSGKNDGVVEHFMSPLVDDTTRFLDPTCGSGNAVKIARRLKAEYSLGLEINKQFADRAAINIGA